MNNRILFAVGAIVTGIITGFLLSPKSGRENRKWVNENAREATDWIDKKSRKAVNTGSERVNQLTEKVRDTLPELYEVTKRVTFQKK